MLIDSGRMRALPALALCFAVACTSLSGVAHADGDAFRWEDDDHSYDRARRAVSRGDILPIEKLLEHVSVQIPGQVLGIELEHEHDRWVYEFKIINTDGRLMEAYFDAQTGALLSAEDD